jgi:hypothetical protein
VTTTVARNSLWVICCLVLPAGPAAAASIWTVSGSASGASQYRQNGQPGTCSYNTGASGGCSYVNSSGFLPYNSSTNLQWTSVTDAYSATLLSSGDSNGLHALAAVSITNDPLDYAHYWQSDPGDGSAYATWIDTFTVGGPGAAYLAFDFGIDGTLSATAHARADATVDWSAAVSNVQASSKSWTFSTLPQLGPSIPSSPLSAPTFLVHPGDSVTFSLRLGAKAFVGCQLFSNSTPFLCSASASSDLSNTLSFASIGFQDPLGNYLPGYSITSNNFSYNQLNPLPSGGAVPEPGTIVLAGSTLLLLAAVRRARVQ